ncbi:type I restriction enzyme HsdR N-terminal domain-containing protein [Calothrix sp. FACHB-1219]|uniref:type I restriction enzyme HsdR N-terminal domain-containing protein n=1 Tax=unclassified Calothrix TaxID=2619626 RepID=UPI001681F994|nr:MULTISPECIES: type I restriction enzyme HsdR N-terminal domain-containing protein [unclassified Calothrix]MBD2205773.1 type I restriction enzyme HsdR N-terminal domain-containing protein [Calothrix sp. FACHB-168]MBD2220602.1 type I restriction enzyme HsdR N-terminal domain-containing protein [Calothrix sp. FACHB-1219]
MEAAKFQIPNYVADIVVLDKDEQIVLLVEVKATKLEGRNAKEEAISQLKSYLQNAKNTRFDLANDTFAMLADLGNVDIFKWHGKKFSDSLMSLKTSNILSHYDPEFSNKRILSLYLETLVEAWLRDLAYHWKSETPPASEKLAEIGLLQKLEGGTTQSQVNLDGNTLR